MTVSTCTVDLYRYLDIADRLQAWPWPDPALNLSAAQFARLQQHDLFFRRMSNFYAQLSALASEAVFVPHGHFVVPMDATTLQRQLEYSQSLYQYTYSVMVSTESVWLTSGGG